MPDDLTVAVEDPHAMAADEVASTVDVDPATGLSAALAVIPLTVTQVTRILCDRHDRARHDAAWR